MVGITRSKVFFFVGLAPCFKWSLPKPNEIGTVERLKILEEHSPILSIWGFPYSWAWWGYPFNSGMVYNGESHYNPILGNLHVISWRSWQFNSLRLHIWHQLLLSTGAIFQCLSRLCLDREDCFLVLDVGVNSYPRICILVHFSYSKLSVDWWLEMFATLFLVLWILCGMLIPSDVPLCGWFRSFLGNMRINSAPIQAWLGRA